MPDNREMREAKGPCCVSSPHSVPLESRPRLRLVPSGNMPGRVLRVPSAGGGKQLKTMGCAGLGLDCGREGSAEGFEQDPGAGMVAKVKPS